jgi:hypothetical protein
MDSFLRRLHEYDDSQLMGVSRAIELELERRLSEGEDVPESARQRAVARQHSYRRSTGSAAPPIRAVGLRKHDHRLA